MACGGLGLTSYAELNCQRKLARPLYLELRSLELDFRAHEHSEETTAYSIEVWGLRSLSPAHAERVRRRVEEEHEPELMRILIMGKGDEGLCTVLREEVTAA